MEKFFLISIGALAVFWDLWKDKIPNSLVIAGLGLGCCWQITAKGLYGILDFLGGAILPLLLLAVLFYFRMMGAGDIKLFAAIGSFVGMKTVLMCMMFSFLAGAVISIFLIFRRGILRKRLTYFFAYFSNYYQTKNWIPYRNRMERECSIHFSLPVFISLMMYVGGIY